MATDSVPTDAVRTQFKIEHGSTIDCLALEATSATRQARDAVARLQSELDEYLHRRVLCRMDQHPSFCVDYQQQTKKRGGDWGPWGHTNSFLSGGEREGLVTDWEVDESGSGRLIIVPTENNGRNHLGDLVRYRIPVDGSVSIVVLTEAAE